MIRPSMLPIARYCGHAAHLAEKYPESSVAAEAGTAFHAEAAAHVSGAKESTRIAAIMAAWDLPERSAYMAEQRIELRDPESGDVVTAGTADVVILRDDSRVEVVDWKTGRPEYIDPPDDNLQVLAYGLGVALHTVAPAFRVGIHATEEPPTKWSRWYHDGDDYWQILAEIQAAAGRDQTRPVTGPHCDRCWQRQHCTAWMLPATAGDGGALACLEEGGTGITRDNLVQLDQVVRATEKAIGVAKGRMRDYLRDHGPVEAGDRVLELAATAPRRSLSLASADEVGLLGELELRGAVKESRPGVTMRWRKRKRGE